MQPTQLGEIREAGPMKLKTSLPEECEAASMFFENYPDIGRLFKETWVRAALNPSTPRHELPPFFWILVDPVHAGIIAEALAGC